MHDFHIDALRLEFRSKASHSYWTSNILNIADLRPTAPDQAHIQQSRRHSDFAKERANNF